MKKSLLLAVSAFVAWSANAQHRTNLEETLIPTEGKNISAQTRMFLEQQHVKIIHFTHLLKEIQS